MTFESIFSKLSIGIVLLLTGCLGLAIFGYFKKEIVVSLLSLFFCLFVFYLLFQFFRKKNYFRTNKFEIIVILLILFISVFNGFFHHDLPRGRDDMGYIAAAVKLTESSSLSFNDIITRPYHPFRNLGNDEFTSQFLPGYNVYLGIFYLLGGLKLLFWANSLLLFFSLTAIYFISKNILDKKAGLISILLFASLYVTIWFSRRTNSENLLMFLVFLGIWLLITGFCQKKLSYFTLSLFTFSSTILVRGEAIAYLATSFLVIVFAFIKLRRQIKTDLKTIIPFAILSLFNLFLLKSYTDLYGSEYIEYTLEGARGAAEFLWQLRPTTIILIALGVLAIVILYLVYKKLPRDKQSLFVSQEHSYNLRDFFLILLFLSLTALEAWFLYLLSVNEFISWNLYKFQYVFENFIFYFLIPYLLISYWGFYKNIFSRLTYIIIFILSPSFVFLISPSVAVDQPWFMRRFYAVFIPLIIILSGLTIRKIIKERQNLFRFVLLLMVINLSISLPILGFSENKGVQSQLRAFANKFSKSDLVLMEPDWQWQQWGYGLHYIYKLDVLPNLDGFDENSFRNLLQNYKNVYIISSTLENPYPGFKKENLKYLYDWSLQYPIVERTSWMNYYVNENMDALEIKRIREEQKGTPPRRIELIDSTYHVFKVIDKNSYDLNLLPLYD